MYIYTHPYIYRVSQKKWDLAFAFITQAKIGPCKCLICQIKGLDEPDRAVLVSFKNFYLLMRYFEKTGQK